MLKTCPRVGARAADPDWSMAITDMAITDMAITEMATTDMAITDMAITDMAITDMAITDMVITWRQTAAVQRLEKQAATLTVELRQVTNPSNL